MGGSRLPFRKGLTANSFLCNQVAMLVVVVQKAHWKKHCNILLSYDHSRTPPPCPREMLCKAGGPHVFKSSIGSSASPFSVRPSHVHSICSQHPLHMTGLTPFNCTKVRSTNPAITIVYWLNAMACVFQQVRRKEA